MEYLADYGLFLAKLVTVLILVLAALGAVAFIVQRSRESHGERLRVKHLNEKYEHMALTLKAAMLPRKLLRGEIKEFKTRKKQRAKQAGEGQTQTRIFVLRFKGDIQASAVKALREEVTAVLLVAAPGDEVVVLLESLGGVVHSYGLAASQLCRFKENHIPLTVAVDKVAASGGYMMACVADRLIAAPFAVLGSIGVIAQLPNFNRLLKNHDIDFEQITAGEYKRTLTLFGENTDKGREKFRQEMEDIHALFKEFVAKHRAQVDVDKVATGEHWHGLRALELKLVDELLTSDDYLREASQRADLYEVQFVRKKPLAEQLVGAGMRNLLHHFSRRWGHPLQPSDDE